MTFKLPELPYAYDALGPYMSKETLEFHHDKHHLAYVDNGNKFAGPGTKYDGKSIEEICKEAFAAKDAPVINNIARPANARQAVLYIKLSSDSKFGSRSRSLSVRNNLLIARVHCDHERTRRN